MKTLPLEKVITDLRNFELIYTGDVDNDYEAQHGELAPLCEDAANAAADALESQDFEEFAAQIDRIRSLESDMGDCPDWCSLVNSWEHGSDQWNEDEFKAFAEKLKDVTTSTSLKTDA